MALLTEQEKNLALEKVMTDVEKKYGKGMLVRGADARGLKIQRLKTGSIALDVATGGGWAGGKLNEIFGPYSGGKSYVSQLTMAQTQKDYPSSNVALIDFEGAFDAYWARRIGVNTDELLISSPEFMEDGLQLLLI
jgi:recombination protein RecA